MTITRGTSHNQVCTVNPEACVDRQSRLIAGVRTWLHGPTGRLVADQPPPEFAHEYLAVLRPDARIDERGRWILSFDRECPVCVRSCQGLSKIMDLATKGEAPFAHLFREQVALQPATRVASDRFPNGGRRSLRWCKATMARGKRSRRTR